MNRRRRSSIRGAAAAVLVLLLIIGLVTKHIWWALGVVAVLAAAWLVIAIIRTNRDLDAELARSKSPVVTQPDRARARGSAVNRADDPSGNGRAHPGTTAAGED